MSNLLKTFSLLLLLQSVQTNHEEIEAIPIDQKVAELDREVEARKRRFNTANEWEKLDLPARTILASSMAFMIASCYTVQLFPCFVPFALTDRIRDLKGNHWYNLVLPAGWVACAFFLVSCCLFYLFVKLAQRKVNRDLNKKINTTDNMMGEKRSDSIDRAPAPGTRLDGEIAPEV